MFFNTCNNIFYIIICYVGRNYYISRIFCNIIRVLYNTGLFNFCDKIIPNTINLYCFCTR